MDPAADASTHHAVRMQADFVELAGRQRLQVRYRVENAGPHAVLLFDHGDVHAVMTGRLQAGAIAAPAQQEQGGDLTLVHRGLPIPPTEPTLPPVPLTAKVEVGASYEGAFTVLLPQPTPAYPVRASRVRYCLGVAAMPTPLPAASEFEPGVWQAWPEHVAAQQMLCSPWFVRSGAEPR